MGRNAERIPADQNGARLLVLMEPQEEVREADDGARPLVALAPNRLGQGVIGAMREGVAVDDEKGLGHRSLEGLTRDLPSKGWSRALAPGAGMRLARRRATGNMPDCSSGPACK